MLPVNVGASGPPGFVTKAKRRLARSGADELRSHNPRVDVVLDGSSLTLAARGLCCWEISDTGKLERGIKR